MLHLAKCGLPPGWPYRGILNRLCKPRLYIGSTVSRPLRQSVLIPGGEMSLKHQRLHDVTGTRPRGAWLLSDVSRWIFPHNKNYCNKRNIFHLIWLEERIDFTALQNYCKFAMKRMFFTFSTAYIHSSFVPSMQKVDLACSGLSAVPPMQENFVEAATKQFFQLFLCCFRFRREIQGFFNY